MRACLEPLGRHLELRYGKPLSDADRQSDGEFPAYGANGEKCRSNIALVHKAGIVVGRKGAAGEVTLTDGPFWPLDVTYFAHFDEQRHDLRYLYYVLAYLDLPRLARGVKPGINRDDVYREQGYFPPFPEQQRIVAILDEAFEGIAIAITNTRAGQAAARKLVQQWQFTLLNRSTPGWERKPLGHCFRLRSGDGLTAKAMVPGAYPVFGGNGIAGTHNVCNVRGEQVVIGRVGALCGNARYIDQDIWLTDNAFRVVESKVKFDKSFLAKLLNSKSLRDRARQSAQPVISNSSLKNLELAYPQLISEQQRIADLIDTVEILLKNLESLTNQKINALERFRQSLLHQAFTGQL